MCQLFAQNINDIDIEQLQMSLKYTKEREFMLGANVVRFQNLEKVTETVPEFVNERLEKPE